MIAEEGQRETDWEPLAQTHGGALSVANSRLAPKVSLQILSNRRSIVDLTDLRGLGIAVDLQ